MSQPDPPKPRKRPKQARSLMLVEAIREACLRILRDEGAGELTTQRIADVAGVNIASLYQYFPNKEAVLADVFEDQIAKYTEDARRRFLEIDRLSRESFRGTLEAIIEMHVTQCLMLHRMDPAFYRAFQHSFDMHRRVNELTLALDNPGWEEWFPEFLARHRDKLRNKDIALMARLASHALSGIFTVTVAEDPALLEQDGFGEEVLDLLLRYLCKHDEYAAMG